MCYKLFWNLVNLLKKKKLMRWIHLDASFQVNVVLRVVCCVLCIYVYFKSEYVFFILRFQSQSGFRWYGILGYVFRQIQQKRANRMVNLQHVCKLERWHVLEGRWAYGHIRERCKSQLMQDLLKEESQLALFHEQQRYQPKTQQITINWKCTN